MYTLPRSLYPPGSTTSSSAHNQRPVSEFDSGINTSTAWTEHLVSPRGHSRQHFSESDALQSHSLSDESDSDTSHYDNDKAQPLSRTARVLYAFAGTPAFRELSVAPRDELLVLREDAGQGWSLVKDATGQLGLVPKGYYQFDDDDSATPRASSPPPSSNIKSLSSPPAPPDIPQSTGDWLPRLPATIRQRFLGGRSLNRFSSFVASGAEAYILSTDTIPSVSLPTHNKESSLRAYAHSRDASYASSDPLGDEYFVDAGAVGPAWRARTPPFRVLVHSPLKRTDGEGKGMYTMYNVTSVFPSGVPGGAGADSTDWVEVDELEDVPLSPVPSDPRDPAHTITVQRRFSHFAQLHSCLTRLLPGVALPPLPAKSYAARMNADFVEARRGELERYLAKLVRHPLVRAVEGVMFFLSCEDDSELTRLLPAYCSASSAPPSSFYARTHHPAFNLDAEDAVAALDGFKTHTKAVGTGVEGLRVIYGSVRDARVEMSKAERMMAYALLDLVTSSSLQAAHNATDEERDNDCVSGTLGGNGKEKAVHLPRGLINTDGAWCWREGCKDCLRVSKAVQKTCETLQTVANLYDGHARMTQLTSHESLKLMAHPLVVYEGVTTTHKSTLSRYRKALGNDAAADSSSQANENMASRCETVLNTTMAEMDIYHAQKSEDLKTFVEDHLDGEIRFYEQILNRLKSARAAFNEPTYTDLGDSPRPPSIYERDLQCPDLSSPTLSRTHHRPPAHIMHLVAQRTAPLDQPAPHVFDAAPMRPVSIAIQEGVGMLFGGIGAGEGDAESDSGRGGKGVLKGLW